MNSNDKQRLRWCCRRGMLELDMILLPFFEENFDKLDKKMQENFVELLDEDDPDLFSWIMGNEIPENENTLLIINEIKRYAENRSHR